MAKGRKGPALFELLGEDGGRAVRMPRVSRWWGRGRRSDPRPETVQSPTVASDFVAPAALARATGERAFEITGDRVSVSLTSLGAAGVIFLTLAVMTAAYLIGSRRGDRAGFVRGYENGRGAASAAAQEDEVTAARNQPPAAHLLTPLRQEVAKEKSPATVAASPAAAPRTGWARDLTYIVVQEFPVGASERARNAQQFLADRGVPAEVVPVGGGVHLIATQGYNHKDAGQKKLAEQLLTKIRTVGGQYYTSGGGYKLEGYYKTLKRDTW